MHNDFTRLLGIDVPVIGAPMAKASEADLCAAVAKAGGIGMIGAGYMDPAKLSQVYAAATRQLQSYDTAHSGVGIGLFNYSCSKELLQTSIDLNPRAIWLSFGDWAPLAVAIKQAGIKMICQVQHLEQVEPALLAGADIIVGQSHESGGHGASPASLVSLIPELVDCVNALCQKHNILQAVPVAAAGGICDARQMAAAFALGASGVVLGTCLNATHESVYPEAKKQALVKAGSSASCNPSTIRTSLYDELSGLPWPASVDGQCLRNDLTAEYSRQTPLQDAVKQKVKEAHDKATADHTVDKLVVWSGSSIGLVKNIQHAEDVVNKMVADVKLLFLKNAQLAA
ncbi:hypothetical protein ABBQ38_002991 [Trebouxia sp. C0009 RCD-2024]